MNYTGEKRMKHPLTKLLLIAASVTLISCGGDGNKVNTSGNDSSTNYGGSNQQTTSQGGLPSAVQSLAGELSNSLRCQNGQRLSNFQQYYAQAGQGSNTAVCGNFQQGVMSGTAGQKYIGVSPYNDFMIVSEVLNGSQVVGHNVFISMCSQYLNYYGTNLPLIANERALSGFQAPNCLILDKDNFCPHGVVDAGVNTYMVSASYQFNVNGMSGQLQPYEAWTTFFKPTCNGQY